jgi:hypothetical protein
MAQSLPVINLAEAKFECTFGRGCDGICCQNGRPPIFPDEVENIDKNLDKFLDELRPEARRLVEEQGYLSGRRRNGLPMLRVIGGWCVFFNKGCVVHKVGAAEGDKFRYKPAACALFPVERDEHDQWYVRQKGFKNEKWNLFCLDPQASALPAEQSLASEVELARKFDTQEADRDAILAP